MMKPIASTVPARVSVLLLLRLVVPASLWAQLPAAADPPYIPTPMSLVRQMLDMAAVSEEDVVYDLGSGDGRMAIAAAQRGARAVGIEYEGWLVQRSRASADSAGVASRVRFLHQDVFEADVREATVVLLYLSTEFNLRLRPRLLDQLRPGARVVSHAFHMGDWQADWTETIGSGASRATLFAWLVPAEVDGFWSLQLEGENLMTLEFRQRFQLLSGQASLEGRSLAIANGSLSGDRVSFELVESTDREERRFVFSGRLEDGRLSGSVRGPEEWGTRNWRATRFNDASRAPS